MLLARTIRKPQPSGKRVNLTTMIYVSKQMTLHRLNRARRHTVHKPDTADSLRHQRHRMGHRAFRSYIFAALFLSLSLPLKSSLASTNPVESSKQQPSAASPPAQQLSLPARSWAADAAANEIVALRHAGSFLRYRMHVGDEKGDRVRDVIESRDGAVARLILRDGKPLTPAEDLAERQRLQEMLSSPEAFTRHIKNEDSGKKLAENMIRLLPSAMLYTYTPGQPQTGTNKGATEIVLDYQPDPAFVPPSLTAQALTGLRGRMWIDASTRNLVRAEGELFRPVNFGWGMIAHIYPGGKLLLVQTNAGSSRWIFSHFSDQINIRAVLVKSVKIQNTIETSDFQTIATPTSYQDAIHLLLATSLPSR